MPEDAHTREQVEAALNEAARLLRRHGTSAMVAVRTASGHTFRMVSAPNATEQTELMSVMQLKLSLDLVSLAKLAAQIGDADGATSNLDDLARRMLEEDEEGEGDER